MVPELIDLIAEFLYGQALGQSIRLAQIYVALPGRDEVEIGEALNRMREHRLIEATFQNDMVRLSLAGRDAWNDGSSVEQSMGMEYVCDRYSGATVHVIVSADHRESSGSGFFSADHPGWIVTADHVVRGREILRVLNRQGQIIARPPFETVLRDKAEGDRIPDLALVRCDCPVGTNAVRIEWRPEVIRPMDRLLVLGYPSFPGLLPHLDHVTAELRQVARDFHDERDSLVISSQTPPGSSGGPVLSHRGRAIGVVEQQNMGERIGEETSRIFLATPARYLAELRPQNLG
jgi:S1-C subfamily serine protease